MPTHQKWSKNTLLSFQKTTSNALQTKLGKAVAKVLGITTDVCILDHARLQHKLHPKNKDIHDDYLTKLALIQTKVLAKLQETKQNLKQWEKEFYSKNSILASNEDVVSDATAAKLLRQTKFASALLKEWKINL